MVRVLKVVTSVGLDLDSQYPAAQADSQHARLLVFVTLLRMDNVGHGVHGALALEAIELALELVQQDLHVQHLKPSSVGIALQA